MKNTLKGYVAGLLSAVLLMAITTGVFAIAQLRTETVTITYGVGVSLDGTPVQFAADAAPFTLDGRTFLPVRAIADLAGLDVDFNAATNTVVLTSTATTVTPPPQDTTPPVEARTPVSLITTVPAVRQRGIRMETAVMQGEMYINALRRDSGVNHDSTHVLAGQYQTLTAVVGRIDARSNQDGDMIINFWGDGVILDAFMVSVNAVKRDISVDVTGVSELRIEFTGRGFHAVVADIMIE